MILKPIKARLLEAETKKFIGKDGNDVTYNEASVILEDGTLLKVGVTNEAIGNIEKIKNQEGQLELEIKPDFKQKAKIRIVSFK